MTPEFKYGLLSGAGVSLWMLAEYKLGLHTTYLEYGNYTGYFSLLIPLLALFFLLRKKQVDKPQGFSASVVSGVTASFLGALIVYGFSLAYNQWINPEWIDNALALKVSAMRAHNVDENDIRSAITSFRQANRPIGLAIRVVGGLTVIGGIFSALLTWVLRQQSHQRAVR